MDKKANIPGINEINTISRLNNFEKWRGEAPDKIDLYVYLNEYNEICYTEDERVLPISDELKWCRLSFCKEKNEKGDTTFYYYDSSDGYEDDFDDLGNYFDPEDDEED